MKQNREESNSLNMMLTLIIFVKSVWSKPSFCISFSSPLSLSGLCRLYQEQSIEQMSAGPPPILLAFN